MISPANRTDTTRLAARAASRRYHGDDAYDFRAENGQYTATEKYGSHEQLSAPTPGELLTLVRRHYRGPRTDMSST